MGMGGPPTGIYGLFEMVRGGDKPGLCWRITGREDLPPWLEKASLVSCHVGRDQKILRKCKTEAHQLEGMAEVRLGGGREHDLRAGWGQWVRSQGGGAEMNQISGPGKWEAI